MKINSYAFADEGMRRVYENAKWTVGIKNWKPANDVSGIDCLERHNLTDELFVLLEGRCTLIFANEVSEGLKIEAVEMDKDKVYVIPQHLWHTTVTERDTKMILIEDSNTSNENSDILHLSGDQIKKIQDLSR
jgi:mannose-6-phosphate isomerase-like protein (cupin superfamily)